MSQKHALIVDDSKTARTVLGRMLEKHELLVETAESAEEALEYLSHNRPDVIFMDHMMPGMDGFQAVKAIKNSPVTATIPIMMYTSQAGDLYVSQARALGAVGVLPKQIKPVEVSALLESLHLIPAAGDPQSSEPTGEQVASSSVSVQPKRLDSQVSGVEQVHEPADWSELHGWLAKMLEHHGHSLRDDIEASVARLLKERSDNLSVGNSTESPQVVVESDRKRPVATTILILALALLAGLFFWLHLDTQAKWRDVMQRNAALLTELDAGRDQIAEQASGARELMDAQRRILDSQFGDFLMAIEWTVNQSGNYGPEDIPFGEERLKIIDGLLQRLRSINFKGTIHVDSHVGDFCYVSDENGRMVVAPAELPAEDCEQVGHTLQMSTEQASEQSVSFANYLAELSTGGDNDISIHIQPLGNTQPMHPYPTTLQGTRAGEWNSVALKNNRVYMQLLTDFPR